MVKYQFETYARMKPLDNEGNPLAYNIYVDSNVLELFVPRNERFGVVNNLKESYEFKFSGIFDQDASQDQLFDNVARPLTMSCLDGYNGTIFAYGQTGSGKTYTMSGSDSWQFRGIIPRVFTLIFDEIDRRKHLEYNIYVSFMEIYNENVYDLLDSRNAETPLEQWSKIQLYEDLYGNLHMKNLSIHQLHSEQDGIDLLMIGNFVRHVSSTPMNQASSRSHCIFTIAFESRETGSEIVRTSKLHLVDLAGSERISKSLIAGKTLEEAKYINLSLTYLEQVFIALHDRQREIRTHIPYRNSIMTTILRDSLGGNCKTILIATMSAEGDYLEESISTARFARRCSQLVSDVTINEQVDLNLVVQRLQEENLQLKEQIANISSESQLSESSTLTAEEMEICKKQVAMFLSPNYLPKLIIRNASQAMRCFMLFREAMLIKEEHYTAEIERLKELLENGRNRLDKLPKTAHFRMK
jgi:kinesin family protein 6/9